MERDDIDNKILKFFCRLKNAVRCEIPSTANAQLIVATTKLSGNDYFEAERLLAEVIERYKRMKGGRDNLEHYLARSAVALVWQCQGYAMKALESLTATARDVEQNLGPTHQLAKNFWEASEEMRSVCDKIKSAVERMGKECWKYMASLLRRVLGVNGQDEEGEGDKQVDTRSPEVLEWLKHLESFKIKLRLDHYGTEDYSDGRAQEFLRTAVALARSNPRLAEGMLISGICAFVHQDLPKSLGTIITGEFKGDAEAHNVKCIL